MFDDVHNYYEKIVYNKIRSELGDENIESEFMEDIACLTLNQLPPRYIRFDVDMMFGLSPTERLEIDEKVNAALAAAISIVSKNENRNT